jgi:hypothetical protein
LPTVRVCLPSEFGLFTHLLFPKSPQWKSTNPSHQRSYAIIVVADDSQNPGGGRQDKASIYIPSRRGKAGPGTKPVPYHWYEGSIILVQKEQACITPSPLLASRGPAHALILTFPLPPGQPPTQGGPRQCLSIFQLPPAHTSRPVFPPSSPTCLRATGATVKGVRNRQNRGGPRSYTAPARGS